MFLRTRPSRVSRNPLKRNVYMFLWYHCLCSSGRKTLKKDMVASLGLLGGWIFERIKKWKRVHKTGQGNGVYIKSLWPSPLFLNVYLHCWKPVAESEHVPSVKSPECCRNPKCWVVFLGTRSLQSGCSWASSRHTVYLQVPSSCETSTRRVC